MDRDQFIVAGIAVFGGLILLLILSFVVFSAIAASGPTHVTVTHGQ